MPSLPQWFVLMVRAKQELSVARRLEAKGYELFLPMHTVRRQWSDRVKTYDAPLFPGHLFCRFSRALDNRDLMVLRTPGVICIDPVTIPDSEIDLLRQIISSYPAEPCEFPKTGEVVEIPGERGIRGVLVARGSVCRVAIGFDVMKRTVLLHVPIEVLKGVDDPLTPQCSVGLL